MAENPLEREPNRYERIMIAAREARRLNDRLLTRRIEPKAKVTTEAIGRAQGGDIEYTYATHEEDLDDTDDDDPTALLAAGETPGDSGAGDEDGEDQVSREREH